MKEKFLKVLQSKPKTFVLFLVLSILFRILSFFYSVIDHDESTYLIIANALNNGSHLYTDVIDTKPPGIFLAFSMVQLIFGKSIFAIRLFGSFILSLSAFLLFLISTRFGSTKSLSFFSGLTYIIIFSCYRFGLAINTELFFSFFALVGLYMFQIAEVRNKTFLWLLGGLAIGIGFIFKYVILAAFAASCVFFFVEKTFLKNLTTKILKIFLALLGIALPFVLVHIYFLVNNRFEDFYEVIYNVTARYSSEFSFLNSSIFLLKFHVSYFPFIALYYYGLFNKTISSQTRKISALWFIFALIMVILPGKSFKHYYLQLLPSLSLIIPLAIDRLLNIKPFLNFKKIHIAGIVIGIAFSVGVINQSYFWFTMDTTAEIANKLRDKVESSDIIIAAENVQLTYYLLNLSPPSKYVHPTIIFMHTEAFAVSTEEEMNKMLDKNPKFIVYQKWGRYYESNERIMKSYHPIDTINKVKILEINSGNH